MPEILPSTGDPIEVTRTRTATADRGEETITTKRGPVALVEAQYEADLAGLAFDPDKSQLSFDATGNGRGTYRITNARSLTGGISDPETGGLQELSSVDVSRPWYTAPYFATLSTEEIALTRRAVEDGIGDPVGVLSGQKSYQLFGHMVRGDNYYATAYLFRRTFRTTSGSVLVLAASNINTVQPLPALNSTVGNLIGSLPVGEWLKRPTTCRYLGREGWDVSDEYLWAPQWSVVYGGTFTGE
jgi:hypothetical protein